MASDSSVIEVYSQGELLLPFSSAPTFEEMLQRLEDHLSIPRDNLALFYTGQSGNEHQLTNEDQFQEGFSEADLPFIIRLETVPSDTGNFFCPYCDAPLGTRENQCQKCKTVNWDSWFIEKRGEEQYRALQETKGREIKGFSFGPVDFVQEHKPVFEEEKRSSPGGKSEPVFVEDDDDLNQRGSMEDLQRVSFGEESGEKFQTPPRKPTPQEQHSDPNPRFQMSDGLVDFETPPRDSQPRESVPQSESHPQMATPPPQVPEAIISDSPDVERRKGGRGGEGRQGRLEEGGQEEARQGGGRMGKPYRGGLQPSPYLSPEKPGLHDRATCAICQRSQRGSSILTYPSEYKDSLFRYSRVTGESSTYTRDSYNAQLSTPSRFISEESLFASRISPFARRSYYSPERGRGEGWGGRSSFTKPLRESGGKLSEKLSGRELGRTWVCRKCGTSPPWYFTHCQSCELTMSLGMQPYDLYKRRVELMCRR